MYSRMYHTRYEIPV